MTIPRRIALIHAALGTALLLSMFSGPAVAAPSNTAISFYPYYVTPPNDQGQVASMNGHQYPALFDGLGRQVREEVGADDAASPDADSAVKNAYTLAAHSYDVSKWVDDEYRPAWEGASWLDE